MEPDIKNLLTQKIRAEENEPISWNKSEVWSRVEDKISSRKSTYRSFYYVAAAIVLALLSLTPQLKQKSVQSTTVAESTPISMDACKEQTVHPAPVPDSDKALNEKGTSTSQTQSVQSKSSDENLIVEKALVHLSPEPEEPAMAMFENPAQPDLPEVSESRPAEKIEPIVGIIDSKGRQAAANNPKRKRWIRKLEPVETEEEKAILNTILFARNK